MATPYQALLEEGIAAARAGQNERARDCLLRVVEVDERNLQAWYWLSRVVESASEREICLENVLALDPGHMAVQAELAELRRESVGARPVSSPPAGSVAQAIPHSPDEQMASESAIEPLHCPYCGLPAGVAERQCPACGQNLYARKPKSSKHSAYSLGLVLGWLAIASWTWLGLAGYYLFASLASALDASPAAQRTLAFLSSRLGLETPGPAESDVSLLPVLLIGGLVFGASLVVAWGLYRRWRFFYWLTVGVVLLLPLRMVYQVAVTGSVSWLSLILNGILFLLCISFAFMAYDEFAWEDERLDATVDRDVTSHSALFARGREVAGQGMWAKAAVHWSKAVALSPGRADYRLALASAYVNLGQPDRAREHLLRARQIEPQSPEIDMLLAQIDDPATK